MKSNIVSINKNKKRECYIFDTENKTNNFCVENGSNICYGCRIFAGNNNLPNLFRS